MIQAFGAFYGSNASPITTGSGNFSIVREGPGVYRLRFTAPQRAPVLLVTPMSASGYSTATAVVLSEAESNECQVLTGYTDKPNVPMDSDFAFMALWP